MILPMSEFVKAVQDDPRSTVTLHIIPYEDQGFSVRFFAQGISTISCTLGKRHGGIKLFRSLSALHKFIDQIRAARYSTQFIMC